MYIKPSPWRRVTASHVIVPCSIPAGRVSTQDREGFEYLLIFSDYPEIEIQKRLGVSANHSSSLKLSGQSFTKSAISPASTEILATTNDCLIIDVGGYKLAVETCA